MKTTAICFVLGLFTANVCAASEEVHQISQIEPQCISKEDRVMFAQMLIQCSAASNTKSDEEGEDVVAQCEVSVRRALCPEMKRICLSTEHGSETNCSPWTPTQP